MKFIWVFHAKNIKQLSIIVIAALFAASMLYIERSQLMVFSTPEGPQAFYKAENEENRIALTFNLSWGENRIGPILDVLEQKKVENATFFVSASWAETYPELLKEIKERGYTIGSHGYQYKSYTNWDDEKVRKDLRISQQLINDISGQKPTLLRPPNGDFDKRILKIADAQNFSIVHWSVNSRDYENPGVDAIVKNVVPETSPGDVLLFHASDSVKQTHKALPVIVDQLRDKGFEFATVDELMASTNAESEEIK
ncbi:polysaccharide deacetylase family sporulation protein PdaB [Halalkalibacter urbisdiaboli]|uniref:polysaccharide deacetylase family sporulation protein PdaB n=1 Tax=Halalkalibacter urbisdiaboli TaxID=1960589 RepID=UPI000B44AC67|nr:polysaccharide deacetylase family sporulation protein PdaB [Halalkalibacter urbisdiaboli]